MEKVKIVLPLEEAERAATGRLVDALVSADHDSYRTYQNIRDAAWKKFNSVRRAHGGFGEADYKVRSDACVEHMKSTQDAWKAHCAALGLFVKAWEESDAANAANPLVAWIMTQCFPQRSDEAVEVLWILADGGTLDTIDLHAEREAWCEVWDDARNDALQRFEIVERD